MEFYVNHPWEHYAKWNKPVTKWQILLWFYLDEVPKIVKFIETESKIKAIRRRANGERLFNEYRVSVWEDERLQKMDSGESSQQCDI